MEYKVTEKDLIGDIKDFPIEVVQKMVDYQVEQGNEAYVTVFQTDRLEYRGHGGFNWDKTKEGLDFWHKVIEHKDFNLFFHKYPKPNKIKIEKDMETNKLILNSITLPADTEVKVSVEDGATIITFQKQEEKEPEFKRGDIIYVEEKDGGYITIIKNIEDDVINVYSVLIMETNIVYTNEIIIRKNILSIRKASRNEESKMFQELANQKQLRWNAEELKFEPIRWRAERGGKYWYIGDNGEIHESTDIHSCFDNGRYNFCNYFQTKELIKQAFPKLKEFFKNISL